MSTKIQWTHTVNPDGTVTPGETWNPTTGCNKVSAGCKNCYAEKQHFRLQHMHPHKYTKAFSAGVETHEDELIKPLKWKKPRKVFVNSMSDLFHPDVPFEFIDKVFTVMSLCPHITFQILTKRPGRMAEYFSKRNDEADFCEAIEEHFWEFTHVLDWDKPLPGGWFADKSISHDGLKDTDFIFEGGFPLKNVWLGTSCEDQATANERIPYLLQVPAEVRFLSCEPLLGPMNLKNHLFDYSKTSVPGGIEEVWWNTDKKIHWVIAGGESGNAARPMHPDWVRSLRDQCAAAGVPFFFKQWGAWMPVEKETEYSRLICSLYEKCNNLVNPQDNFCPGTLQHMEKVGKHASGNTLDGKVHEEFPKTYTA